MSALISLALESLSTYLNRVVVLVTPFFAAGAAWLVAFIADNIPGAPEFSTDQLTALAVAGALAATHAAVTWLKGWSRFELDEAKRASWSKGE